MSRRDGWEPTPLLLLPALALLAAWVLAPALFGDRALVGLHTGALSPWTHELPPDLAAQATGDSLPLLADKTIQFWPLLSVSLERLSRGEAPLWNPLNLGGVPLLAQGFQGAFHPPNWLAWWLPPAVAFGWIAWLQALMAGGFAALLARELGCRVPSALLAGTTWMLCGYLSSRWHWYQISGCSAYLPLALWGVERLTRAGAGGGPRAVAVTALAVGMAWLTGWLQGALHLVYACGVWALVRLVPRLRTAGAGRRAVGVATWRCGLALTLGLALAAPQIAPTLAWVASGESARSVEPPEVVASLGMEPAGLLGLLSTDNLGHPRDVADHPLEPLRGQGALMRWAHEPHGNYVETSSSIGLVALILALLGACRARRGRGLALGLALVGLTLALRTPLLLFVARLPGLASGDPKRFLLLASLGLTLLAAFGLDDLLTGRRPAWALGLAALAAGLALTAGGLWLGDVPAETFAGWLAPGLAERTGLGEADITAEALGLLHDRDLAARMVLRAGMLALLSGGALLLGRRDARLAAGILLGLAVTEQALAGAKNAVTVPRARLFEAPPRAAELADPEAGRVVPFHRGGTTDPLGGPLPGNVNLPFGIDLWSGYWALSPRRVVQVIEALQPGSTFGLGFASLSRDEQLTSPVLDLFDVGRVLSREPLEGHGLAPLGPLGDAWLFARGSRLGPAWFSSGRAVGEEQALEELLTLAGDPRVSTPLSPRDGLRPPDQPPRPAGEAVPVTMTRGPAEHVTLTLDAPADGVVVLSQTFHPGWSAEVDGEGAVVWPAWHALTAVQVPAGAHTIELRYHDLPFALGRLLAWAAAGALVLLIGRRRAGGTADDDGPLRTG